jgi:site-specific recombinase XerD
MSITKLDTGQYCVDMRPQGRDVKCVRKTSQTKSEAQQYERWAVTIQHNKEWVEKLADRRPLVALIDLWYSHHGRTLKNGDAIIRKLVNIAERMGQTHAEQVTRNSVAQYRAMWLASDIKPNTIITDQTMLSGVFTALIDTVLLYHDDQPLTGLARIKRSAREMTYVIQPQIIMFLAALAGDALKVALLCLATGARWSKAATLTRDAVIPFKCTFVNTMNYKDRTVPISEALHKEITKGNEGRELFPKDEYYNVWKMLKKLVTDLPEGHAMRVMRQT